MKRYMIYAYGQYKAAHQATVAPDGVLLVNGTMPIVNSLRLQKHGITAAQAAKAIENKTWRTDIPNECFCRVGKNGHIEIMTEEEFQANAAKERENEKRLAQEEAERMDKIVPGLSLLRAAIEEDCRYREEFTAMMDDGDNDGARPPKPVQHDESAIRKEYPAAAAYIKAENFSFADHYDKAGAGRKAITRLLAGEDHETVIAEMDAEWTAAAERAVWNS